MVYFKPVLPIKMAEGNKEKIASKRGKMPLRWILLGPPAVCILCKYSTLNNYFGIFNVAKKKEGWEKRRKLH